MNLLHTRFLLVTKHLVLAKEQDNVCLLFEDSELS